MVSQLLFIGTTEWIAIAVIVLLLFGGKKLPELMRGLGEGLRGFKEGMKEAEKPAKEAKKELDDAVGE
jgi:sec-independent protein translocase protein TatA